MGEVEELRKGGFIDGDDASSFGKLKPKLEAKPGEIRIKRTIRWKDADGQIKSRVLYYTDK